MLLLQPFYFFTIGLTTNPFLIDMRNHLNLHFGAVFLCYDLNRAGPHFPRSSDQNPYVFRTFNWCDLIGFWHKFTEIFQHLQWFSNIEFLFKMLRSE